ncbi:hypothetical protein T552_00126 [Pneumocystis carinii B80]|uniref:Actin-related protein 2/3 complex subunit 5 n=1 Tax=Pneumocystis carinii (strain B80) TaxID=1408658 RepID=A0A0W4ZSX1_PNEC8|nr:hypothetical protein T552_00126 [Pneumocystis carinii B80]KTW31483.1 hypothetical protein T552_00126 [Pneumocystis carinii B80]
MSFRQKQVDIYNSDILKKEDLFEKEERSADEIREDISKRTPILTGMILKGKAIEALVEALINPPYGDVDDAKKQHMDTIFEILSSIKPNEISNVVETLSTEQQDVLMKYLYKGFTDPKSYNPAILLNWHEKLVKAAGHGCIVRSALTDMRVV